MFLIIRLLLWCGAGSNRRHKDFQSFALPTELPHHLGTANIIKQMEIDKNTAKKVVLLFLLAPVMATFNL